MVAVAMNSGRARERPRIIPLKVREVHSNTPNFPALSGPRSGIRQKEQQISQHFGLIAEKPGENPLMPIARCASEFCVHDKGD